MQKDFLSTRKSDKEGFDNIESFGRKEPGRDAAIDARKARRRTQRSQPLWGRHPLPGQ